MASLDKLEFILPKKKQKAGGQAATPGYNAGDIVRPVPSYDNHRQDLFDRRQSDDSRALLNDLVRHDPDVSSAIFAFGTIAGSAEMYVIAYDPDNQVDADGIKLANAILAKLFTATDYSLGYNPKMSKKQFLDDIRFSTILRGIFGIELVYDKALEPYELRLVDMATVEWQETKFGVYKPLQEVKGINDPVSLDIPTFFTEKFHQNPNDIYAYSTFVSSINTIAARQQVINDLYRIMQLTGYPRLDITVLESVLMQNAPPSMRNDPKQRQQFVDQQLASIRASFTSIRPDQAFVHTDAVEAGMVNDKNPGASLKIDQIIDTLDAQNQAALKTMPSVVGKGQNGDTASAEARLFALSCDSLNKTVAAGMSEALTFACRVAGFQGRIEVRFPSIELRPTLELEPHFTMKASRLKQDLSLGIITDLEYHLQMYQRPPPNGYKELSGTGFLEQKSISVNAENISPNDDPNGRGLANEKATKSQKSNQVKSGEK